MTNHTATIEVQAARIRELEQRLAWREAQATARLTPEEHRCAALAAFAAVEAAQQGNLVELEVLAPRTVAEMRSHLAALTTALAALADRDPHLVPAMRSAILNVEDGAA